MKVITEQLDVRDGSSRNIGVGEVARKENKGHVADIIRVSETWNVSDFERRVPVCEKNLGRILDLGQAARVHKFLHDLLWYLGDSQMMYQAYLEENFSKNAVCLFPEDSGEYDGDTVVSGSDIDSLLITIMNSHQISLSRRRAFKFLLCLESYLKGRSQRVSFQERNRMDKGVPLFFNIVSSLNDPSGMNTLLLREVLSQDR